MKIENAFITGSHAYGTPNEKSDIDLVIRCSVEDAAKIVRAADGRSSMNAVSGSRYETTRCKVGQIDLILCVEDSAFELWKRGTEELKAESPVTREEAIEHFDLLREEMGVGYED